MADITGLVPHILRWETGATRKGSEPLVDYFARARRSGWSDDPLDKGGATMCGVTLAAFRARFGSAKTKADLRQITFDQWLTVLRLDYWNRWQADDIASQSLAEMLVDWVWASGSVGIKRPQKMLGVQADGIVGPKTLAALAKVNPRDFFEQLRQAREAHFREIVARTPSQARFLQGWLNRINALAFKY